MGRPRSDEALLTGARAGDGDAYAELVRAHQQIAFRTAMLITHDAAEAEDAAQEGLIKAWRALPRFRAGAPVRPWLLAIVANEARNRRRAGGRRERLALRAAAEPQSGESAESALLAGEQRAGLLGAIGRLREEDRLVIGCRYLLELSEAETAAALGVRPGTVKSRLARALDRLRTEVDGDA